MIRWKSLFFLWYEGEKVLYLPVIRKKALQSTCTKHVLSGQDLIVTEIYVKSNLSLSPSPLNLDINLLSFTYSLKLYD